MLEHLEIIDHSGHCSARRDADSFYINSGASLRNRLTTADIVAVDLAGALIEGSARPPLEFHLHAEIYRARPDVQVVMHTHPRWSTLLTIAGVDVRAGLRARRAAGRDSGVWTRPCRSTPKPWANGWRRRSARAAPYCSNHTAPPSSARDIIECFALVTYLEENARRQYMALQIGSPYVFSAEEQDACRTNLWSPGLFAKSWRYYRSKVLRSTVTYYFFLLASSSSNNFRMAGSSCLASICSTSSGMPRRFGKSPSVTAK